MSVLYSWLCVLYSSQNRDTATESFCKPYKKCRLLFVPKAFTYLETWLSIVAVSKPTSRDVNCVNIVILPIVSVSDGVFLSSKTNCRVIGRLCLPYPLSYFWVRSLVCIAEAAICSAQCNILSFLWCNTPFRVKGVFLYFTTRLQV